MVKIEVSMKLSSSFSLSKVLCCLSKVNFLCLYLSTNSSMFLVLIIILYQSHLILMISVEYVLVLLYYGIREYLKYLLIHKNNLKKLWFAAKYISRSTSSLSGSHAAIDSNKKLLSASIIQLQSTVLFNNTYG